MSEQIKMADEINRLTAESEVLQAEVERLRTHNEELQRYNIAFAESELRLEQERDQLKAQNSRIAKVLNEAPEVDHVFTDSELAEHDAEVIEQMLSNMCHQKGMTVSHYKCADLMQWMRGYVEQLRQQSKEVKS